MDETWSWLDVGKRVRESRLALGLSQEVLGEKIGLGRTAVVKIESGKREIDALELAQLAEALGLPLEHFLRRPPAVLSRRADLADQTSGEATGQAYRLEAALQQWLSDIRQLSSLDVLRVPAHQTFPAAVSDHESAREAARWVRAESGHGNGPIESLMSVCDELGQLVCVVPVPGDGASLIDGDVAGAVISLAGDPGRRRTTAAHELGHFVLGDEYSSDLGVHASRNEREALINTFAAELLLPISAVRDRAERGICSRDELIKLAAVYRTSWTLAVCQAVQAGVGDWALSRTSPTRAELLEATGWIPQPDLESVRVSPLFAQAVLEAWRNSMITSARAVEMMRGEVSLHDLPVHTEPDAEP